MGAKDFKSSIVQKDRLLPGIHGLRGVAALAIVLFHLIHLADINPPAMFSFIGRGFGYAVHLFFILSAYSLMHSTESQVSRENWVKYYFIKRFFRIAPLFYSMIIFFMACGLFPLNNLKDFNNLLLNLTFTFGFAPETGILWGGWSVGVEMLFYAIFPTLILLIKSSRDALILLIFSTIVACGLRSVLHYQYLAIDPSAKYDWSYYSFAANFCFFSMGIYAYLLGQYYPKKSKIISTHIPLIAVIIFSLLFSDFDLIQKISSRLDIVL